MSTSETRIAILGLGEAGRLYAHGLAGAGAAVTAYDPLHRSGDPVFRHGATLAETVVDADIVLSLVGARAALEAADDSLPFVRSGAVFADLNTAAPAVKAQIAALAAARGVGMADIAIMAPVPRAAHRTPLLASGPAAAAAVGILSPLGVPIEAIGAEAGDAARLRLLRSVFMKGLAALVLEGMGAARGVGAEEWMRGQIAAELGPDGDALVDRLITGTHRHAERREHEVRDVIAELDAAGQPADVMRAALAWLERIIAERDQPPGR